MVRERWNKTTPVTSSHQHYPPGSADDVQYPWRMVAVRGWGWKRTWWVEVVGDGKKEGEPVRVDGLGGFKRLEFSWVGGVGRHSVTQGEPDEWWELAGRIQKRPQVRYVR